MKFCQIIKQHNLNLTIKIVLLLLVLVLNVYLRLFPAWLPKANPQPPKVAAQLRSFLQDDNKNTYFLANDPFHWKRYAELTIKNGYPGDALKDGKVYDLLTAAPTGAYVTKTRFLFYMSAFGYKVLNVFHPSLSVDRFLFYFPVFISVVFLLLLFLFVYSKYKNYYTAILSVFTVGLSHFVLLRTSAGWFDMDGLALIFMLLMVWCAAGIDSYKQYFKIVLLAVVSLIYCYTWQGWWFSLCVAVVVIMFNNVCWAFKKKKAIKYFFLYFISVFIILEIVFLILEGKEFVGYLIDFLLYLPSWDGVHVGPNALSLVSELSRTSLADVAKLQYGYFGLFLSLLAVVYACFIKKSFKNSRMMFVLFIATSLALIKSYRFAIFWMVPVNVCFSVAFVDMIIYVKSKVTNCLIRRTISSLMIVCVVIAVIQKSFLDALNCYPLMNTPIYKALKFVDKSTPKDALVMAWWDYGDWIKDVANRGVFVDGQTQHGPFTYWMARFYMTNDLNYARNIVRWFANGASDSFYIIDYFTNNRRNTISIIERLLNCDRDYAKTIIDELAVDIVTKDYLLSAFYNDPNRPVYVFVESGMRNYGSVISEIAAWNSDQKYILSDSVFNRLLSFDKDDHKIFKRIANYKQIVSVFEFDFE